MRELVGYASMNSIFKAEVEIMPQTYKATLRGNHLEWSGETPEQIEGDQAVIVYVTILNETARSTSDAERGKRMAEALAKLASLNPPSEISDPSVWERDERQERQLPGRDEPC